MTGPKTDPPFLTPPSKFKKFRREAMSHELGLPKRREFRLELSESRRSVPGWTGTSARGRGCARLSVRVAMCEDNPKSNNERLVLAHDDITTKPLGERSQQNVAAKPGMTA
jgi:hypothetical protein